MFIHECACCVSVPLIDFVISNSQCIQQIILSPSLSRLLIKQSIQTSANENNIYNIYIYIYIYIYTYYQVVLTVFWLSFTIHPNRTSLMAGLLGCITCPHTGDVRSLSVYQHGASMCWSPWENVAIAFVFASPAVLCISCLSYLNGLCDGRQVAVHLLILWGVASKIFSRQGTAFLCSFHLAFFSCVLLVSMWYIPIVVWTKLQLGRYPVLLDRVDQTSMWLINCQ